MPDSLSWTTPVTSFSAGSTGLTPSSSTTGAVTLGGTLGISNGGTGQTTAAAAFDALSPMTTAGDIMYGGTGGTGLRLAKGNDGQVLTLSSGVPTWSNTRSDGIYVPASFTLTTIIDSATTTFTVPAGVYHVTLEALGGSGGGGGSGGRTNGGSGPGGGGGGGEYAGIILSVVPGDVIGITIGAAGGIGSAGAATPTSGGAGGNGGQTIVTLNSVTVLTANGGAGGSLGVLSSTSGNKTGGTGGAGGSGSNQPNDIAGVTGGTGTTGGAGGTAGTSTAVTGSIISPGGVGGAAKTTSGAGNAGAAGRVGKVAISYY